MTIVGISRMALTAQSAAEELEEEHEISAEVIDPRTLRPLDLDTILASVRKTNRCVIVEEGWPHGGVGANLAALIQEQAFDHLDAPIARVTGADLPMPYSKPLEQIAFPHEPQIVETVLSRSSKRFLQLAVAGSFTTAGRGSRVEAVVPLTPGVHTCGHALAGGGDRRRPRRRRAGHDRRLRLLAPRGPAHHARPERGQHGPLRVHGAGRPGQADRRLELGPAAEPGGRAVLRQARSRRRTTTSRSTTRATASRTSPTAGSSRTSSATRTRSCTRFRRSTSISDPNLNFVQTYDLYYERYRGRQGRLRAPDRAATSRSRPTTSGPKTMPELRAASPPARSAACRAAARRSSARPTTRSSSTSARSSTASTSTSPAARRSGSATRAAARTTSPATTSTRSCCRSRRPRSPATAAPSPARRPPTPSSASGRPPSARRSRSTRKGQQVERWVQVSRLGNPLINEVIIPIGLKDKYNATSPADDAEELRRRRAEPRAGARSSTRCSSSASRRTTARTSSRRC